jgi:glycerophosphoryl diester phosphodiesterase
MRIFNLIPMRNILSLLVPFLLLTCEPANPTSMKESFDWQGHRGARGLAPENSLPGFQKALEYPITTLELDLALSRDSQLVVSHEPWFSASICSHSDGRPVGEEEEQELNIFQMDYAEVAAFDCGSRIHASFPEQEPVATPKPRLWEVVALVDSICNSRNRAPIRFNIEIKSKPEWDGKFTPGPQVFSQLVLAELERLDIESRSCIQSFDPRVLEAVHARKPDQTLAFLVEYPASLEKHLAPLSFLPEIYSPMHTLLTQNVVDQAHEKGLQVIPWTVNDTQTMRSLIQMGVDGIITDYPNLIREVVENSNH